MLLNDAMDALNHLSQLSRQVNAALEMMPPSQSREYLLQRRNLIRAFENSYVWPNKDAIHSGMLPGFLEPIARRTLESAESAIQSETNILLIAKKLLPEKSGLSGLWDVITGGADASSSIPANDEGDVPRGRQALQYYFDYSSEYPNFPYSNFDSMVNDLTSKSPELVSTIGFTIRANEMSDSTVQDSMQVLAEHGAGNLPSNVSVFFNALGKAASNPSFFDSIPFVAAASFHDAATGLQKVGQGLIDAGTNTTKLLKYLPYFAIAAGAIYVFTKAGGLESMTKVYRGKT